VKIFCHPLLWVGHLPPAPPLATPLVCAGRLHGTCVCTVAVKRNCIEMSAPGDKCYHSAEYAPQFYKQGATVPLVNFRFL